MKTKEAKIHLHVMNSKFITLIALISSGITGFASPAIANSQSERDLAFESACATMPESMPQEFQPPTFDPQALPDNLSTPLAWQTVGENAAASGDFSQAIQAFNKAIDLTSGENATLFEKRGWLHYMEHNYQQAITDLKSAALLYDKTENLVDRWDTCHMVSFVERQRV